MPPRPAWRRKRRRVSCSRKTFASARSNLVRCSSLLIGICVSFRLVWVSVNMLGGWNDEGVLGLPREQDPLAVGQCLRGPAGLEVLGIDGQLVALAGLDEVLGADPDVAGVENRATQLVEVAFRVSVGRVLVDGCDAQLLRTHSDPD